MKKKTLSYTENGKQTTVLLFKNINILLKMKISVRGQVQKIPLKVQ